MKNKLQKLFLLTALIFCALKSEAQIQDGWYEAQVKYSNYSTGTFATYILDVKVSYERVVAIAFGNGGSVHTGYNNSGYIYGGGYLYLSYGADYAETTVTISEYDGTMRYFKILIQ